jgi:transposase
VSKRRSRAEVPSKGRWSTQRKTSVVLRLLRGESLDEVSRETGVTAARLSEWREVFLAAGALGLKSRREEAELDQHDSERRRLRAKIGEMTMERELLEEKIARLVEERPTLGWKSK